MPEGGCDVSPLARISIVFDRRRIGPVTVLRVRIKRPTQKSVARTSSPSNTSSITAFVSWLSATVASESASICSLAVSIAVSRVVNWRMKSGIIFVAAPGSALTRPTTVLALSR
ncbi:hypothetical protein D3C71_1929650 [compost metagenome]